LIEVERMSHMSRSRTLLAVCFLLLPAAYTLAEDVTPEPPEATEPLDADRELLVDTLLRYEPEAVHDARDAVDDAMRDLDDAMEGGDPAQIEAREKDLRDAEEALETAQGGYEDAIRERVYGDPDDPEAPALTDAQVAALNQSLHNTRSNGLVPAIGPEELDEIIEGMFGDRQIRAFTKAYEEEAKFLAKADRFDEDSKQHDGAIYRAEQQKSKFLAKVARFGGGRYRSPPREGGGPRRGARFGAQGREAAGSRRGAKRRQEAGAAARQAGAQERRQGPGQGQAEVDRRTPRTPRGRRRLKGAFGDTEEGADGP
jgi:hypothetical protein